MMTALYALSGGVLGGALLGSMGGAALGALVGGLWASVADLAARVRLLERRLEARPSVGGSQDTAARPAPDVATAEPPRAREARPVAAATAVPSAPAHSAPAAVSAPSRPVRTPRPSLADTLLSAAARWITTGNVPVKVGVVLSLFGVGFLVKEGMDRQWFVLPVELRLALVAAFGIALLVVGWRLRDRQRVYALSVQGGGIGVLYLTIYAAFALYGLLPVALTFALLVVVTVGVGTLAVLQDARALAVLGVLGGFLAPVLASTGSGSHVALFSYYALLDLAIFGIAWFRAWRVLNVLGFAFTFGIASLWGAQAYRPEYFATTEPFLILFTLIYLAIPVLFATRSAPNLRGFVDGTLLFGTPVIAFALQSRLVAHLEYGLAVSAVVLAAIYVAAATYLYRRHRAELRVLVEAQLALAIAFATVAVPLALDARWTSAAWALQGAALVWLGCRQQRRLPLAAGLALQLASGIAYFDQGAPIDPWPLLNGPFLGSLLLAFAGFFSARLLDGGRERPQPALLPAKLHGFLAGAGLLWAAAWWFGGANAELDRWLRDDAMPAALLLFVAGTVAGVLAVARRIDWPRLDWLALAAWPAAGLAAAVVVLTFDHPAQHWGFLAWPAVVAAMLALLRLREARFPRLESGLHATTYWLVAGLVVWQAHWLVAQAAGEVWPMTAALATGAVLLALTLRACTGTRWPFARHAAAYLEVGCGVLLAGLAIATFGLNVHSDGTAAPLPYVPVANPLDLASALVVLVGLRWLAALARHDERLAGAALAQPAIAAGAAWLLATMIVARSVHHFAGVPYGASSLMASTTFQGALSIVWGSAGLAAMLFGARFARRAVWLAGAVLMGVVVAKLLLVDLGNTGTLARVVSFLGVGVLLLVVGYFAPAPPRAEARVQPVSQ
jgi:uncharacterized membrane protein